MVIFIHIIIALASLIFATYGFFKPSQKKLFVSYGLMVATVGSGTYLLLATQASILHTCLSGLFYLTVTLTITIATQYRLRSLTAQKIRSDDER